MKVRVKFTKTGVLKYLGHLDMMRFFQKALRRAEIPVAFSKGYSPHMIMSFAQPLGVGLTSSGEYFDLELEQSITTKEALQRLNQVMIEGVTVEEFLEIPEDKKSKAMAMVAAAAYRSTPVLPLSKDYSIEVKDFMKQREIVVFKTSKRSQGEENIRPLIQDFSFQDGGFSSLLLAGSVENVKPSLVMEGFWAYLNSSQEDSKWHHHRVDTFARLDTGGFVPLSYFGTTICE